MDKVYVLVKGKLEVRAVLEWRPEQWRESSGDGGGGGHSSSLPPSPPPPRSPGIQHHRPQHDRLQVASLYSYLGILDLKQRTCRSSPATRREVEGDPMIYIVTMLLVFSAGIASLMVIYMKKEQVKKMQN